MFKNFSEFTLIPDLSSQDFIVGYTNDGVFSEEYRSTVSNVFGNFLSKNNVTIKNLEVLDVLKAPSAIFSSLTATSAVFNIIDIRQYELSGFNVTGNVTINGNVSSSGTIFALNGASITGNLSTQNYGTAQDWSYKQNFIGTPALTSTTFLELLANRNCIQYDLSATLTGFSQPHGTSVVNNKIYLSNHLGSGTNGQIVVINDPFGDLTNQTLITLPNETNIPAICYHKQSDRIYGIVASNTGDRVIRFNPNNNTYDTFYTLAGGEANSDSCIINDDEYLYVGVFPKVFRIRISDATLVNTYQNGFELQNVHSIQISPDGQYILCTSDSSGDFHRINIQTGVINTISLNYTFSDDSVVLGDYFYFQSEDSAGRAYKINWKDLTVRVLYSQRPGWGVFTDGRFVYFLHNYVGFPGGIPTPTDAAFIYKYDPENETWHTIYLATTIPLLNVANRINEMLFVGDKVFLTNYGTGSDKIFRSQIKTEVTTVPILRDDRPNWDINAEPVYNLFVSNVSATNVIYSNELDFGSLERPSLTGIKQALNSFLYVSPALSYVRINGSSSQTLEVGQALTTPAITWNSNKLEPQAVSQYMLTLGNGSTSTGNFTFSSFNDPNTYNITTIGGTATQQTSSWSVRVTDWAGAQATGTASANWRYRVYFGVTSSATPNSTDILNGVTSETNRPLAISRTGLGAKTVSPTNQYFYVAYPQRFGITSTIRVNGLNFTDFTQQSIGTFTNASGGTDSYYVYRSNNLLTATYTIEII
jgi:hypothetical protein